MYTIASKSTYRNKRTVNSSETRRNIQVTLRIFSLHHLKILHIQRIVEGLIVSLCLENRLSRAFLVAETCNKRRKQGTLQQNKGEGYWEG